MSKFVHNLLHGIKTQEQIDQAGEIARLSRMSDTMGIFARAARETFEKTGRESCLSALALSVHELGLSVRAANCLTAAQIQTISQLVQTTSNELFKHRNFGKRTLQEIEARLAAIGLSLSEPKT